MKIEEVRKAATDFLRGTLQKEGAIVKISKTPEGWEVQVEVIEPSEFIKALGIPTVVRERNLYEVKLGQDLEVVSYERIGQQIAARKTA
ncbi:MAG: gas vesicle protein [Nitrospirae bacterium]|nr:gas vesicle protein [Nitrospirota bacterium]